MMKWLHGIALVLVIGSRVTVAAEPPALLSTDFNTPESQTCGIQEAIDKLPETGGMVMVPAGLFEMHAPVVMKPNVKLAGETVWRPDQDQSLSRDHSRKHGD